MKIRTTKEERSAMRIFKTREFSKFARKEGITDKKLRKAVEDAERGLIDADYGGGVIKQRVARPGEGKSGGFRTIILYRRAERAFFVHGFAKSDKANLSESEERVYKDAARIILAYTDEELATFADSGIFKEVKSDEQEIQN